jgi:hypothetical protein
MDGPMTFKVELEGGPLDGREMIWSDHLVLFGNSVYMTVYRGCFMIPKRYKYLGEAKLKTLQDLLPTPAEQ